jgi:hypothetical protein
MRMATDKFPPIALMGVIACGAFAMPLHAQQPAGAAKPAPTAQAATPASDTAAADNADASDPSALLATANAAAAANAKAAEIPPNARVVDHEPTAAARRKAADYGFHSEMYDGKTFFCKDDATLGTRLISKKCIDPDNFEDYAIQLQIARDTMRKDVCQGGKAGLTPSPCGGIP